MLQRRWQRLRALSPNGPLERLHERIVAGDRGWFFAQIADKVAERRVQMGMSQRELAVRCGTTQSAIARLERGGRPPRIDTLLRIAEALDCELLVELVPNRALARGSARARRRRARCRRRAAARRAGG